MRGLSPGVTGLTGMRVDGVARMTGMMSTVAAKHTKVVVMRTTVAATGAGRNTKVATAVAGTTTAAGAPRPQSRDRNIGR